MKAAIPIHIKRINNIRSWCYDMCISNRSLVTVMRLKNNVQWFYRRESWISGEWMYMLTRIVD